MTSVPPTSGMPAPDKASGALTDTARQFEAVFLAQLFQAMFATVEESEFSGGNAEHIFQEILAENMGNAVASNGGIGLAPSVMETIIKLQGDDKS